MSWTLPIFYGLGYHIQLSGADRERVTTVRTQLESNGAIYCPDPTSRLCDVVIAFSPKRSFTFSSPYTAEEDFELEPLPVDNIWTFDEICVRLGRRPSNHADRKRHLRKHVIGADWVEHCLKERKLVREERWGCYEVMTEPLPFRHPSVQSSTTATLVDRDQSPVTKLGSIPASVESHPETYVESSRPDDVRQPPSLLVAKKGVFHQLTHGPGFPQTFHVVKSECSWPLEHVIESEGGQLDSLLDSTFIIVQSNAIVIKRDRELLSALQRKSGPGRRPVSAEWIHACIRAKQLVPIGSFVIQLPAHNSAKRSSDAPPQRVHETSAVIGKESARLPPHNSGHHPSTEASQLNPVARTSMVPANNTSRPNLPSVDPFPCEQEARPQQQSVRARPHNPKAEGVTSGAGGTSDVPGGIRKPKKEPVSPQNMAHPEGRLPAIKSLAKVSGLKVALSDLTSELARSTSLASARPTVLHSSHSGSIEHVPGHIEHVPGHKTPLRPTKSSDPRAPACTKRAQTTSQDNPSLVSKAPPPKPKQRTEQQAREAPIKFLAPRPSQSRADSPLTPPPLLAPELPQLETNHLSCSVPRKRPLPDSESETPPANLPPHKRPRLGVPPHIAGTLTSSLKPALPIPENKKQKHTALVPSSTWAKPRAQLLEQLLREWVHSGSGHKTVFLKALQVEELKTDWWSFYKRYRPFLESRVPGLRDLPARKTIENASVQVHVHAEQCLEDDSSTISDDDVDDESFVPSQGQSVDDPNGVDNVKQDPEQSFSGRVRMGTRSHLTFTNLDSGGRGRSTDTVACMESLASQGLLFGS